MPVAWTDETRARASPRRWPGEAPDPHIDAAKCVREVQELGRRWDEATDPAMRLPERWQTLRLLLARCDDQAYAQAQTAARSIIERAPIGLRCAFAFAFPHEAEWSAACAREALGRTPPLRCGLFVLRSIADPDLATRLALALLFGHGWEVVLCAYDLVAAMGEGAGPVLIAIEDQLGPANTWHLRSVTRMRSPVITALALVRTDLVAKWIAGRLDRAAMRRLAARYFAEAPELADPLRAEAKKRSAAGRAAKTILTMVTAPASDAKPEDLHEQATDAELPVVLREPPWRSRKRWPKGLVVNDDVAIALITGSAADRERWAPRIDWVPRHLLDSSAAAWAIVHAMFHRDEVHDVAREWLLAMPEIATAGLVPMAVGKDARRRPAGRVLRMLVAEGHGAAVERGIAHYEADEVRAAARAVLAIDAHFDVPASPPTMPGEVRVEALPPPRLRSGKPLPRLASRALAELLQIASDGFPYAGVDDVRAACDEGSLEAFSLAVFEAWNATGAATKSAWPLHALAIFGGDAVARDLGPRVRAWAQQHQNERARDGLRVLEAIGSRGSDVALVQLVTIGDTARFPEIAKAARAALDRIAVKRGAAGLDREALADRLAPDLGLDEGGRRVLDYGPRRFVITLDEHLVPVVTDERGARTASLPRPAKTDDAAMVAAARETFRALKTDAEVAARTHIRRFENALRRQRKWSRADFSDVLLPHRVLGQIARRLVWAALGSSGERIATFRVVEDGSLADENDRTTELGPNVAHIVLAHPLHFEAGEAARWGELFASYEIMQPFLQIARETFTATDAELGATSIKRHEGVTVPAARLFAMEHRGWTRSGEFFRLDIDEHHVLFHIEPGITKAPPPQSLGPVFVYKGGREARFGELTAIDRSEVLRDLALLVQG